MDDILAAKEEKLHAFLQTLRHPALAFSGGVDSSLLLAACIKAGLPVVALTADTPLLPRFEKEDALRVAAEIGAQLYCLHCEVLAVPEICTNGPMRCYYCKKALFGLLRQKAAALGCSCLLDGANSDDAGDYRPGMRAAAELGILSPLLACGFSKADVRALARAYGLSVADKPACACLATRIATGETITAAKLQRVEEAETALRALGLRNLRVRSHGALARSEGDPGQLQEALGRLRGEIAAAVRRAGFTYVTLDMEGFRSGSMNAAVQK